MPFRDPPQLVAVVVEIRGDDLPGIFINIKGAFFVEMTRAVTQGCFDDPDPMQFVAQVLRIQVQRGQHVAIFKLIAVEFVTVIGDVHFLFTNKFPVVTVGGPVEHVKLVGGAQTVGGGAGVVVGDIGSTPDAALTGIVNPGAAWLGHLVEGFMNQQHLTSQARRSGDLLKEHEDAVVHFLFRHPFLGVDQAEHVLKLDQGVGAAARQCRLGNAAGSEITAIAQHVVPQDFNAACGNREGDADNGTFDAVTIVDQFGGLGDLPGGSVDALRGRSTAAGRVNIHFKGVVVFQQGLMTDGQLVAILIDIGSGDGELNLISGKGINMMFTLDITGRRGGDSPFPGGDGAGGVTGALST